MDFRNPNVTYQAKLDLDAKTVWSAFEEFGGWIKWSPLFSKMTLQQCFKSQVSEPTYFRDIETIFGHVYREELVRRDASKFEMIFKQVKTEKSNPLIDRYETMLTLEPINAESCNIIWKSNIALIQAAPAGALEQVLARQKTYFKKNTLAASTSLYVQGFTKLALAFLHEKSLELQGHLLVGNASPIYEYESYALDPVEWPMPKYCRGLPLKEALPPKKIGFMVQRTLELGYLQAAKFILEDAPDVPTNFDYEGAARKLASTYGNDKEKELTAALLKNYDTEEEFCQQFLAGINPLLIEVVKNLDQLPVKMRAHTIQDFDGKTKTAQALLQEKRLFIVDFHELKKFQQHKKMYFYAPILVLYKEILDEGESRLNVFAIQVERTENAPIFYPNSPHPNRYKLAKMFVACADVQIHQFGFHLAISHYGNEPVAVAVNRKLPEGHPMRALLLPHFNNTIGINYGARNALVPRPEIALTNYTFSVGTVQGQQLASTVWRRFHFFDFSFPKQLEARGFYRDGRDGLDNYHFRDDGFKLWDAIGNYTQNFVYRLYQSDQEVANDKDLQAFCVDLSAKEFGNYPGFPTQILTRDLLWQVLQIIIWNASALHSFLNYPQWPYVGLINNRHNALYKPMPAEDGNDITDEYIKESLAPTFASLFQLTFCWLLSGLDEDDTLVTLRSLKDFYPDIDNRFQIELQQVTKQIEKRNEKLVAQGKIPYVFLMPENVANSCNI